MHSKTLTLILAAALVLALGGSIAAGERGERGRRGDSGRYAPGAQAPRGPHGKTRKGKHGPRFGSRGFAPGVGGFAPAGWLRLDLSLSPEQRTQAIDVLSAQFRAGLEAGMALQDAREEVKALRQAASTDADAIVAAHRAIGEARGQLAAARLKARAGFAAILTPEQLEKFTRFGQGAARRGGMGWGPEADLDADSDAGLGADADPDADAP